MDINGVKERVLRAYSLMSTQAKADGLREEVSGYVDKLYEDGEKNEDRLAVSALAYLKQRG